MYFECINESANLNTFKTVFKTLYSYNKHSTLYPKVYFTLLSKISKVMLSDFTTYLFID